MRTLIGHSLTYENGESPILVDETRYLRDTAEGAFWARRLVTPGPPAASQALVSRIGT